MATQETRSSWDPWQEMQRLQREMQQLFGCGVSVSLGRLTGEYPPLNVTRASDRVSPSKRCVPRRRPDQARCHGRRRGRLRFAASVKPAAQHTGGSLSPARALRLVPSRRTVNLGESLDPDRTPASYTDGILRLKLARVPEAVAKENPVFRVDSGADRSGALC